MTLMSTNNIGFGRERMDLEFFRNSHLELQTSCKLKSWLNLSFVYKSLFQTLLFLFSCVGNLVLYQCSAVCLSVSLSLFLSGSFFVTRCSLCLSIGLYVYLCLCICFSVSVSLSLSVTPSLCTVFAPRRQGQHQGYSNT